MISFAELWLGGLVIGSLGTVLIWKLTGKTIWNTKTGIEILDLFHRLDAWHKSWRSYKQPGHITVPNISERLKRIGKDPDWMQDPKQE